MSELTEKQAFEIYKKGTWKDGIVQEGYNPLCVFGEVFSPSGYCWLKQGILHLPMIIVNPEDRNKGNLTKLLAKTMEFDIVKIWIPSDIVLQKSWEHGFYLEEEYIEQGEEMNVVMIYRKYQNIFDSMIRSIDEIGNSIEKRGENNVFI